MGGIRAEPARGVKVTLNHYPGTLDGAKYGGSAPIAHDASRVNSGTVHLQRLPREELAADTLPVNLGSPRGPPPDAHAYVDVALLVNPTLGQASGAIISQERGPGTLSRTRLPAGFGGDREVTLSATITSQHGSYRIQSIESSDPDILRWAEYRQERV